MPVHSSFDPDGSWNPVNDLCPADIRQSRRNHAMLAGKIQEFSVHSVRQRQAAAGARARASRPAPRRQGQKSRTLRCALATPLKPLVDGLARLVDPMAEPLFSPIPGPAGTHEDASPCQSRGGRRGAL